MTCNKCGVVTCFNCGAKMQVSRETRKYDGCGLPNVTLRDVEVRRCAECGEEEIVIPAILGLHRAIALCVVRKHGRLTGPEVRFLRKFLGWSGADFARRVGVDQATVSRWENGPARLGAAADRFLRLAAVVEMPVHDYELSELETIKAGRAKPIHLKARVLRKHWILAPSRNIGGMRHGNYLDALSVGRLRKMLRATECLAGVNSASARIIRRTLFKKLDRRSRRGGAA